MFYYLKINILFPYSYIVIIYYFILNIIENKYNYHYFLNLIFSLQSLVVIISKFINFLKIYMFITSYCYKLNKLFYFLVYNLNTYILNAMLCIY